MPLKHAYILPIIEGILYPITFAITYTLSVINRDIPPVFPYVSDTGAWSVEKCIFTFTMGVGSVIMFTIIYIRHRQVEEILENHKEMSVKPGLKTANKLSFRLAVPSALGIFVLGCFQVWPFIYIHLIGAGIAFFFGWLVLAIQTHISFKLYPVLGTKLINIIRMLLVLIIGAALLLTAIFGGISLLFFKGDDITQWTERSGGYDFHLISVGNEWIVVLGTVFYLSLYTKEFRSIVLYKPKLDIINI